MSGAPSGFPGGARVFSIGRAVAQRVSLKPPWRVRQGAGPFERAVVGALTFLLALPVAILLLALGVVLLAVFLAVFLGCAAIFVAFALAMWLVRRVLRGGRSTRTVNANDGRENVRVIPPRDGGG